MKAIDPAKPVPPTIETLWDFNGIRFDRNAGNPDKWWYDILFPCVEDWDSLRNHGPYYTAPPQDWTWAESIRPETDYYARVERVHAPFKTFTGVCRSTENGESLVFEDGFKADRHNDIVRHAFPIVPTDRLSLPATVVFDLIFKTGGLDDIKSDLCAEIKKTYNGYGRQ